MKVALVVCIFFLISVNADWTGKYSYDNGAGFQWQIQDGNWLQGTYDHASFFFGDVSDDNSTVTGFWFEAGDYSGGFAWTSEDEGETFSGTYWYGEIDNEYTNLGSWIGAWEGEVSSDDAFADTPGNALEGVWWDDENITSYYGVDQGFFEGIFFAEDGDNWAIRHIYGHTFDGSNYIRVVVWLNVGNDGFSITLLAGVWNWLGILLVLNTDNVALRYQGYMHDSGILEEWGYDQTGAASEHYTDAVNLDRTTAFKTFEDVTVEQYTGESTGWDAAEEAYFANVADKCVCEVCEVCEECEDCPECGGDDITTQINFNFADLIPAQN